MDRKKQILKAIKNNKLNELEIQQTDENIILDIIDEYIKNEDFNFCINLKNQIKFKEPNGLLRITKELNNELLWVTRESNADEQNEWVKHNNIKRIIKPIKTKVENKISDKLIQLIDTAKIELFHNFFHSLYKPKEDYKDFLWCDDKIINRVILYVISLDNLELLFDIFLYLNNNFNISYDELIEKMFIYFLENSDKRFYPQFKKELVIWFNEFVFDLTPLDQFYQRNFFDTIMKYDVDLTADILEQSLHINNSEYEDENIINSLLDHLKFFDTSIENIRRKKIYETLNKFVSKYPSNESKSLLITFSIIQNVNDPTKIAKQINSKILRNEIISLISCVYLNSNIFEDGSGKMKILEKIIILFPDNHYFKSLLFTKKALETSNKKESKSLLLEALKYSPDYSSANKLLSLIYYKDNSFIEAADCLIKSDEYTGSSMYLIPKIENYFDENLKLKFNIYNKAEMYNEATSILEDGVADGFFDIEEIIEFAKLLFEKNRFDEFVELMRSNEALNTLLQMEFDDDYDKEIFKDLIINQAKLEERNRIMANLSHTVKSMLSNIIDPLQNMKSENTVKPVVIDNALRGAELIRSLVNAMNLSFKGSIEDFIYDVQNNSYDNSSSIEEMFIDSLKQAISITFDGKYFKIFLDNYYPTKAKFLELKQKWNDISQFNELEKVISFLNKYLIKTTLDISQAKEYVIGDDKGSALKLLILIQEIIMNAVKYSSFVSKESRNLDITFDANEKDISIIVSNTFKPNVQVKSSGLGQEIIKNFSTLLQTEPIINTDNNLYSVEIRFKNIWRND